MKSVQRKWLAPIAGVVFMTTQFASAADYKKGMDAANRRDYAAALTEFKPLAEQGNPDAEWALGSMYEHGLGVPSDGAESLKWYGLAANHGNADAQKALGFAYSLGQDVPRDHVLSAKWYAKAAAQGNTKAMVELGTIYYYGRVGIKADINHAVKLWTQAAESGDAKQAFELGGMYEKGDKVQVNYPEAARLYRLAAKNGDARALVCLGRMHAEGKGAPKNEAEAIGLFEAAAQKGNLDGQYELAVRYANGIGVIKDQPRAIKMYQAAADERNAPSLRNLATLYLTGDGVPKDEAKAIGLYRQAAEAGDGASALFMGVSRRFGLMGSSMNKEEAITWFEKASFNGSAGGSRYLADMLAAGEGTPRDVRQAVRMYLVAARQGDKEAVSQIGPLLPHLQQLKFSQPLILLDSTFVAAKEIYRAPRGENGYLLSEVPQSPNDWSYIYFPSAAVAGYARVQADTSVLISQATTQLEPAKKATAGQPIRYSDACYNGDCVRTFSDGRKVRFQAQYCYDGFSQGWEWKPEGC